MSARGTPGPPGDAVVNGTTVPAQAGAGNRRRACGAATSRPWSVTDLQVRRERGHQDSCAAAPVAVRGTTRPRAGLRPGRRPGPAGPEAAARGRESSGALPRPVSVHPWGVPDRAVPCAQSAEQSDGVTETRAAGETADRPPVPPRADPAARPGPRVPRRLPTAGPRGAGGGATTPWTGWDQSTTAAGPVRRTQARSASTGTAAPSIRVVTPCPSRAAWRASIGRECCSPGARARMTGGAPAGGAAPGSGSGVLRRAVETCQDSRCSTST